MNGLERNLKRSLSRKAAPPGFADRVIERLEEPRSEGRHRRKKMRLISRIAAVLLVGTIGTGAWVQHQQAAKEREEAREASALVKLALHIASEKTNIARAHLTGSDAEATSKGKDGTSDEKTTE